MAVVLVVVSPALGWVVHVLLGGQEGDLDASAPAGSELH